MPLSKADSQNIMASLSVLNLPLLGFIIIASVVIFQRLLGYWRLRQFRGPLSAKFSDYWLMRATLSGNLHSALADVHEKYGTNLCP